LAVSRKSLIFPPRPREPPGSNIAGQQTLRPCIIIAGTILQEESVLNLSKWTLIFTLTAMLAVIPTFAQTWSTPQFVANGLGIVQRYHLFRSRQIRRNSAGEAVAVEGATGILTGPVVAISRSLTGTWGTPVTVAASAYRQNNPNIGLGNDGTAVTVWRTRSGVSYAVRSGGTWSAAAPLPVLAGQAGGVTGVAVDGSGNAVAIFTQVTIAPGTYATYRPVGGTWQTKVQLSSGIPVAATPAGTFVASGTTVSTRLAGTSNWTTHTFSGSATVNAGPGTAIAVVGPQVSVSTAAVP
jgi:hypothetical protein